MFTSDSFKAGDWIRLSLTADPHQASNATDYRLVSIDNYGITVRQPKYNDITFYPHTSVASMTFMYRQEDPSWDRADTLEQARMDDGINDN